MSNMSKISRIAISLLLIVSIVLSMTACDNSTPQNSPTPPTIESPSPTTPTPESPKPESPSPKPGNGYTPTFPGDWDKPTTPKNEIGIGGVGALEGSETYTLKEGSTSDTTLTNEAFTGKLIVAADFTDLTIDMPNATVEIKGQIGTLNAKTGQNTLLLGEGAKVTGTLTVSGGNVQATKGADISQLTIADGNTTTQTVSITEAKVATLEIKAPVAVTMNKAAVAALTIDAPSKITVKEPIVTAGSTLTITNNASAVDGAKTEIAIEGSAKDIAVANGASAEIVIDTSKQSAAAGEGLAISNANANKTITVVTDNPENEVPVDVTASGSGKTEIEKVSNAFTAGFELKVSDFGVGYESKNCVATGFGMKLEGTTVEAIQSIVVELYSGTNLIARNTATAKGIALYFGSNKVEIDGYSELSSPFYPTTVADEYWNFGSTLIKREAQPTSVKIIVTDKAGTKKELTNTNFAAMPAYSEIFDGISIPNDYVGVNGNTFIDSLTLGKATYGRVGASFVFKTGLNKNIIQSITATLNFANGKKLTHVAKVSEWEGYATPDAYFYGTDGVNNEVKDYRTWWSGAEKIDPTYGNPKNVTLTVTDKLGNKSTATSGNISSADLAKYPSIFDKTVSDKIKETLDVANAWITEKGLSEMVALNSTMSPTSGVANITVNADNIRANEPIGEGDVLSGLVSIFETELAKYRGYTITLNGNEIFDGTAITNSTLKEALYAVADGFFYKLSKMTADGNGIYLFKTLDFKFTKGTENFDLDFNLNFKGEDVSKIIKMAEVAEKHLAMTLEEDAKKLASYGVTGETKAAVVTVELPDTLMNFVMQLLGGQSSVQVKGMFNGLTVEKALTLLSSLTIDKIVPPEYIADVTSLLSTINSNSAILNKFLSKMTDIKIKGTTFIADGTEFTPNTGSDEYQKFAKGISAMVSTQINDTSVGSYEIVDEPNYYAVPVTFTMTLGEFTFTETVVIKLHIEFPLTETDKAEIASAKTKLDKALEDTFIKIINNQSINDGDNPANRLKTSRDGTDVKLHFSEFSKSVDFFSTLLGSGVATAFGTFYKTDEIKGFKVGSLDYPFQYDKKGNKIVSVVDIALLIANSLHGSTGISGVIDVYNDPISKLVGMKMPIVNRCETESGVKFDYEMSVEICEEREEDVVTVTTSEELKNALKNTTKNYIKVTGNCEITDDVTLVRGVEIFVEDGVTLKINNTFTTAAQKRVSFVVASRGKLEIAKSITLTKATFLIGKEGAMMEIIGEATVSGVITKPLTAGTYKYTGTSTSKSWKLQVP